MKKMFIAVLLLLSAKAFSVDNAVRCTGANCKVKIVTKNGSNANVTSAEFANSTLSIRGMNGGVTPAAGMVGEHLSVTAQNASLVVTAGNWLVWCACYLQWANLTQPSDPQCGVSTTNNTTFENYKFFRLHGSGQSPGGFNITSPNVIYKFSGTTTVYCAQTADGGGTYVYNGNINAIRLP